MRVLSIPSRLLSLLLLGFIRGYQTWVSPMFGPRCKYYPSCSSYGHQAITAHGPLKGTLLTVGRILRCNPFSEGGVNHVPAAGRWRAPTRTDGRPWHTESPASNAASTLDRAA